MDNVLVDFQSGIDALTPEEKEAYKGAYDNCPHIFSKMVPIKGTIESFKQLSTVYDTYILSTSPIESFKRLSEMYDVYVLSTSPWDNPTALNDKLDWIKRYLGKVAYKRVIFSQYKHLNKGDCLIDDPQRMGLERLKMNCCNLAANGSRIGKPL